MIVHVAEDQKFIDGFIENQKNIVPEIENYYYIAPNGGELKHVKNKSIRILKKTDDYKSLIGSNEQPKVIVFHGLIPRFMYFINTIPKDVDVIWIFYGAEIFNRRENVRRFLGPITRKNLYPGLRIHFKNILKRYHHEFSEIIYKLLGLKLSAFLKAIHRVDYMAHWLKEDFDFVVNRYHLKKIHLIDFCYSLETPQVYSENEKNILLIGNSGSYTNNHLDVINGLPDSFITKFKSIVIPLSYSGGPAYIAKVRKAAENKFGGKVKFLESFMPKEEYFELLSKVQLAIMPHYRSQGGGNIRFFMKNKIDLALFEKNPIYEFYAVHGAKIHLIEKITEDKFVLLGKNELLVNSTIAMELYDNKKEHFYKNLFYLNGFPHPTK